MKTVCRSTLVALFAVFHSTAAFAQSDPLDPVPGGATAQTVACVQLGELNNGSFSGTLWKTARGTWQETENTERRTFEYDEMTRDEETVELADRSRGITLQIQFARKKVRAGRSRSGGNFRDHAHILSATDEDGSADCIAFGDRAAAAGSDRGGGGAAGSRPNGGTKVVFVTIKPGTPNRVRPGTRLTATTGPPCPNQPGFFLCPNKFSCAPDGGVCCPGAGACAAGSFCDRFIPNSCISPASPSFCQGTGNPVTGVSLHCAPGSTCLPGNVCDP